MKETKENRKYRVFTLHVEGVDMDRLTLGGIGEYVSDFAQLLGEDSEARFHGLKRGSMKLSARVPAEHEFDVKTRGFLLRTGDAPEDAVRARERLSRRLGIDHARRATLTDGSDAKVIEIPIEPPAAEADALPAMTKAGALQGRVIRIGGKLEVVPVDIQDADGHIYPCRADRAIAKRIAKEIFGSTVRVHGTGRWKRDGDGVWRVDEFRIHDFEVLDDAPLDKVLAEIRTVRSDWQALDDPFAEAERIRRGS